MYNVGLGMSRLAEEMLASQGQCYIELMGMCLKGFSRTVLYRFNGYVP
jgi:hypothetical protein